MRPVLIALSIWLAGCAIGPQPFVCASDAECGDGRCEAEGYCSFVDRTCDGTDRRFGEHAPKELSGRCVAACIERLQLGMLTSCANLDDGRAMCWGANGNGELGAGVADDGTHEQPTELPLPAPITRIATSLDHRCAVAAGDVYCWGKNNFGQLGSPASAAVYVPHHLAAAAMVTVGDGFSCALAGGAVRCWGRNVDGELGANSTAMTSNSPLSVVSAAGSLADITLVTARGSYACATASSAAWCWGNNDTGMLGDGTTQSRGLAAPVLLPPGPILDLSTTLTSACAIVDRDVLCWGGNDVGQLNRSSGAFDPMPTLVGGDPHTPLQLAAGAEHMCMREDDGTLWCWGDNTFGKLGPTTSDAFSIQAVEPLGATIVVDVDAGSQHTCALTTDNRILCWGAAGFGRLGGSKPTSDAIVDVRIACGASAQ